MLLRMPIGAFLLSPGATQAAEALRDDRTFMHCQIEIVQGGMDAAIPFLSDKKTPALLIIETRETDRGRLIGQLEQLAGICDPDTRLILIGALNDIEFYRTLVSSGISDYLIGDIDAAKLKNSITQAASGQVVKSGAKVIGFFGVSGGVGSSVIAHNVAALLSSEQERRVTLIDLDLSFGTAALDLNIEPKLTLVDAMTQAGNMSEQLFSQLALKYDDGLLVVPSPASLGVGMPLEAQVIDALIREAKPISDVILLDIPHGWSPMIEDAIALCDDLILVASTDLSGLRNAKNLIETLGPKRSVDATTRIILNKVRGAKQGEVSDKDFKNALARTPDALIPLDVDSFGRALNEGEILVKAFPKSGATKALSDLAAMIAVSVGGKGLRAAAPGTDQRKKPGFSLSGILEGLKSGKKKTGA